MANQLPPAGSPIASGSSFTLPWYSWFVQLARLIVGSPVDGNFVSFDGTQGALKDSGYSVATLTAVIAGLSTTYVPYTGAGSDVNLGAHKLEASKTIKATDGGGSFTNYSGYGLLAYGTDAGIRACGTITVAPGVDGQGGPNGNGIVGTSGYNAGYGGVFSTGNSVNAPITLVGIAAAPSSPKNGDIYYDSTAAHFYGYAGGAWRQLD